MAFSGLGGGGGSTPHSAPMAEINMIPLVDVMLVLLIIFMITAPLVAHKIRIDLPQASTVLLEEKPDTIVHLAARAGVRAAAMISSAVRWAMRSSNWNRSCPRFMASRSAMPPQSTVSARSSETPAGTRLRCRSRSSRKG